MLAYVGIGLAVAVSGVPASLAQDSRGLQSCGSAATGIEAEGRQTDQNPVSDTGVFVEVPIGRVCVGPEFVGSEPVYVRRTSVGAGMTIVEVSRTPFMPEKAAGIVAMMTRPDQPASW
jgi:hypothetical protein